MVDYRIKYKRTMEPRSFQSVDKARARAYKICVREGWGSTCAVYRIRGEERIPVGIATSLGSGVVGWRYADSGYNECHLKEDGSVKKL